MAEESKVSQKIYQQNLLKLNGKEKKTENTKGALNNFKLCNMWIGKPGEERERNKEIRKYIIVKYFPKLVRNTKPLIQEANRTSNRTNTIKKLHHTEENQSLRDNLENQGVGEMHYQNRDKSYSKILIRKCAAKNKVQWNISSVEKNLESICHETFFKSKEETKAF